MLWARSVLTTHGLQPEGQIQQVRNSHISSILRRKVEQVDKNAGVVLSPDEPYVYIKTTYAVDGSTEAQKTQTIALHLNGAAPSILAVNEAQDTMIQISRRHAISFECRYSTQVHKSAFIT